ncbi:MAG: DUF2892 domain-containing protein [Phycisphaerales bacterium]|nr:DUF2892 domain-containing protein [Planctomycetota bacterium]
MQLANVGGMDRVARLALGAGAIIAGIMLGAFSGQVAGLITGGIGCVLLLTGIVGFCPAYLPLKLSTCKPR